MSARTLMTEIACLASNAALFGAMLPARLTARVRWADPLDELVALARSGRKMIFVALHRYGYVVYMVFGRHVPAALRPTVIGHDGLLSRGQTRAGEWSGYPVFEYRRSAAERPRAQIASFLRQSDAPLLLLPDSGGPYGVVKPGVLEIARRTDAVLVPFAVDARRALVWGHEMRHVVPLLGCRLTVRRGPVLEGRATSRDALQAALEALER